MQAPDEKPDICIAYSNLGKLRRRVIPRNMRAIFSFHDRNLKLFKALKELPNLIKNIDPTKAFKLLCPSSIKKPLLDLKDNDPLDLYTCIKAIDPDFKFFPKDFREMLCFFKDKNIPYKAMQGLINLFTEILSDETQKYRLLQDIPPYYQQKDTLTKISIDLPGCYFDFEYIYLYIFLQTLAPFCPNLNTLRLSLNNANDVVFLLEILRTNKIENLTICNIVPQFLQIILDNPIEFSTVKSLTIHRVTEERETDNREQADEKFNKFLKLFPNANEINVADNPHLNVAALTHRNNIQHLTLERNPGLYNQDPQFESLCNVITNNAEILVTLSLAVSVISPQQIEQLCEAIGKCQNLERLDLSYNGINQTNVLFLAQALAKCSKLKHLNISYHNINDAACLITLVMSITQHCPALTSFVCTNNPTSHVTIDDDTAKQLADLFAKCYWLRKIDLGNYKMSLEAIKYFLAKCKRLSSFNVAGCSRRIQPNALLEVITKYPLLVDAGPRDNLTFGIHEAVSKHSKNQQSFLELVLAAKNNARQGKLNNLPDEVYLYMSHMFFGNELDTQQPTPSVLTK